MSTPKRGTGTMGPAKVGSNDPKQFLKKGSKSTNVSSSGSYTAEAMERMHETRKPPVPKRDEKPVMGLVTNKNFVKENLVEANHAPPKYKTVEEVNFLQKKDFGQVPDYLGNVKAQIDQEEQERQRIIDEQNKPATRLLSEREKNEMITGLRKRWDEINALYKQMPIALNTFAQKQKKEEYEQQLAEIERNIERLDKREVWVDND